MTSANIKVKLLKEKLEKETGKKVTLKEAVTPEVIKNVPCEFINWYANSKTAISSSFKKFKTEFGTCFSNFKVIDFKKGKDKSVSIKGICDINVAEYLKVSQQGGGGMYSTYISTSGIGSILYVNSKKIFDLTYKAVAKRADDEKQQKVASQQQLKLKNAKFIDSAPSVNLYIYTTGDSRGDRFSNAEVVNSKKIFEILYSSTDADDFLEDLEDVSSEFNYLFYNNSLGRNYKTQVINLIKKVLSGKDVIEVWEEGTTGISKNKKTLKQKVRAADYEAMGGENDDDAW